MLCVPAVFPNEPKQEAIDITDEDDEVSDEEELFDELLLLLLNRLLQILLVNGGEFDTECDLGWDCWSPFAINSFKMVDEELDAVLDDRNQ